MKNHMTPWELEESRAFWGKLVRRIVGVPLLFAYPVLGLFSPFLVVLGAILLAPDFAHFLSGFAGELLWSHRPGKIEPLYGIPESHLARGEYEEAEKAYEEIIQNFPKEIKPHIGLLKIAVERLNNRELADVIYQRGLDLLEEPEKRKVLTHVYKAMRTRLKPENGENLPELFEVKDLSDCPEQEDNL